MPKLKSAVFAGQVPNLNFYVKESSRQNYCQIGLTNPMMLQLHPRIPLDTPKGSGVAILVLDYSEDHSLLWTVIDDATGEVWTWPNEQVRGILNISLNRRVNEPK